MISLIVSSKNVSPAYIQYLCVVWMRLSSGELPRVFLFIHRHDLLVSADPNKHIASNHG